VADKLILDVLHQEGPIELVGEQASFLDLARHVREQLALVGDVGVAALVHIEPDRVATSASLGSSGIAVSVLSSKGCVGGPGRRA
jgi:hypothetical protein